MGYGGAEMPASVFQSVNPIYIMLLGLVFSIMWSLLANVGLEPSTPVKFSLGLMQLGLGFAAFWWGARTADADGIVAIGWLLAGYLMHTTGELCLSPVGLSMVTRLSPAQLVSTVMGGWFLATAFSQFLAAIIAQFTGVSGSGEGGVERIARATGNGHGLWRSVLRDCRLRSRLGRDLPDPVPAAEVLDAHAGRMTREHAGVLTQRGSSQDDFSRRHSVAGLIPSISRGLAAVATHRSSTAWMC